MIQDDSLSPDPAPCLVRSRASRYRGGTLIAEDVHDLATHERRLADPGGYRPEQCPRCGSRTLHVHDYPRRTLRSEAGARTIRIVRHVCARKRCGATWRILPAFIARHLWRTWATVERTVGEDHPPALHDPAVPKRTARRWRARLAATARHLVLVLAMSCGPQLEALAKQVGLDAPRGEHRAGLERRPWQPRQSGAERRSDFHSRVRDDPPRQARGGTVWEERHAAGKVPQGTSAALG